MKGSGFGEGAVAMIEPRDRNVRRTAGEATEKAARINAQFLIWELEDDPQRVKPNPKGGD
jgi:hypothetical protein